MTRSGIRRQLAVVAVAAAVVAAISLRLDHPIIAGIAAVVAVGCIAEALRRDE